MILGKFPNIFHVFGKGHMYIDMFLAKSVLSQNVRWVVPKLGGAKIIPNLLCFITKPMVLECNMRNIVFFHLKFSKIM